MIFYPQNGDLVRYYTRSGMKYHSLTQNIPNEGYFMTSYQKLKTSLTIQAHGKKIQVKFDHIDTTADEWVDALKTLLIGISFQPETVDQAFYEYGLAFKDQEQDTNDNQSKS